MIPGRINARTYEQSSPAWQRKLRALAAKIGVRLDLTSDKRDFIWDGKTLAVKYRRVSVVIHDFAHYLVATPELRLLPDFGLGRDPDSKGKIDPVVDDPYEDEILASTLGILYEFKLGLEYGETAYEHSWIFSEDDKPKTLKQCVAMFKKDPYPKKGSPTAIFQLHKLGLITPGGRPRVF